MLPHRCTLRSVSPSKPKGTSVRDGASLAMHLLVGFPRPLLAAFQKYLACYFTQFPSEFSVKEKTSVWGDLSHSLTLAALLLHPLVTKEDSRRHTPSHAPLHVIFQGSVAPLSFPMILVPWGFLSWTLASWGCLGWTQAA